MFKNLKMPKPFQKKQSVTPTAAGVVGAITVAAVSAAAIALSDKKTRNQVTKKLTELKDQAVTTYEAYAGTTTDKQDKSKKDKNQGPQKNKVAFN